jgi:hypothetical protein
MPIIFDGLLFIDAHHYLDLYEKPSAGVLLKLIKEQKDYIFSTVQVADEVQRRKVEVASEFLKKQNAKLEDLLSFSLPDHLFGDQLHELREKLKSTKQEWKRLPETVLAQISQSKDEASLVLDEIFKRAVKPSSEEMERARGRKEQGNAPGKKTDPLGDQLSWEQILTHCNGKSKLWIISRDGDFATAHGTLVPNAMLYKDLERCCKPVPEVFCFDNIPDGLKHFVETIQINAEFVLTPEELEQIKKDALPPLEIIARDYALQEVITKIMMNTEAFRQSIVLQEALGGLMINSDAIKQTAASQEIMKAVRNSDAFKQTIAIQEMMKNVMKNSDAFKQSTAIREIMKPEDK